MTSSSSNQAPDMETITANNAGGERRESSVYREFMEKLATLATPEEKIALGLAFMRSSISQEGTPRFREFWEARKLVLPCFKENINSSIRSNLWNEYVELTVEARRLKEILEEQSAFAIEQIDLALTSMETEVGNFEAQLAQGGQIVFPESSPTIQSKSGIYNQIQRELNLLNTLASRLNGLRKEVMKTDMRIRFKTKFFKRLSELGDHIFPKRKALIEQVSQEFERDIERFVANHFQNGQVVGAPYYALREEIKALQGMAKVFTLSSSVFNRTRMKLSECWDQIKVLEKEHKKEVHAKRAASSENRQVIVQKIEELKGRSEGISLQDLDKEIDEISREMRQTDLQREDVRELQSALHGLRAPHMAAREAKAKAMEEAEKEKLRQKRERVVQTKEKIAQLLKEGQQMEADVLEQSFKDLQAEIKQLDAAKTDLQQMDRSLRQLKDLVADRKERSLLNLSEDDRQVLENLKTVLKQKKVRRQEIKDQLEQHRRSLGSSNLDFERAMLVQELVEQEKERLEKANAGIEEIEQKIAELEG